MLVGAGFRIFKNKGQRRKPLLALFLLATLTAFVGPSRNDAHAAAGEHGVGLGLGQVLLMGDFAKNFSDSLGYQLTYSYEASAMFGLLATLSMSSHSDATGDNSLDIKGFTPNLRINLAYVDKLVIYAFTGFGLFMVDETIGEQAGSVTTLGFDMGTSLNLALDKHLQFGTTLSFHNIFGKTDPATVTDSSPGLSIGGTYLMLSLNFFYIF
ncbi:MAG: outer membrane beta-barrel protein [Bdellovibrionota bacterium]